MVKLKFVSRKAVNKLKLSKANKNLKRLVIKPLSKVGGVKTGEREACKFVMNNSIFRAERAVTFVAAANALCGKTVGATCVAV